jgi:serine/threonine protein kinase
MASKAIENAFQRHPRPQAAALDQKTSLNRFQVPTKAALLERSLRKIKEISTDPWKSLALQGELIQGRSKWHLCIHEGVMVLVKRVDIESGRGELEKIKKLSNHPHIATISQVFESEQSMFFRFEYSRFTLEEILNVHLCLDESHLRIIASSVCLDRFQKMMYC